MSTTNSDQSTGYFSGLIIGFVLFTAFGLLTFLGVQALDLKSPADRVEEGDFSAKRIATRAKLQEVVSARQSEAVDETKLASAIAAFKPTPPVKSDVVDPKSETFLKQQEAASQPPAPATPPAEEAKGAPPAPSKGKAADAPADKGKAAPAKGTKGKGKAKAEPKGKSGNNAAKSKAKGKAKAAPKGGNGKGKSEPAAKAKSKGEAKGEPATPPAAEPAPAPTQQ